MATPTTKRGAKRKILSIKTKTSDNLSSVAAEAVSFPEEGESIRAVRTRVEDVFAALGTPAFPSTVMPSGSKNNSQEAAEYVMADLLEKLATERKKKAYEAAEKAGVFGDSSDYVVGDTVMVFNDPNFSINVKMGKPSTMIGREQVETAALEFLGKRSTEFLEKCRKPRAATKQIIVSMK